MQSPCQRTLGQSQLPWTGLSNEGRGAKGSIERLSGQLEPRNAWTNADGRTHALKALDRGRTKFRWQATMMSCPITDRQISPPVTKIQKGATGAWNQAERVSERNGMAKVDGSPRQLYISRVNRDISSSLFGLKMGRNLQTAQAMVDPARKRDISDRSPFQPRSLKTIFYSSDISLTDGAVHHEIIQH